ncbi:hypothetical protein [Pseudovibrio sp. POLY-S9]|uniref:hypothetical protein n=1 Tax=Pseudovibrio sp. POLY-S9 TaxID=1576596 RepID=UPI000708DCD3|nr:hypothetical protein [Pseudovibrio sp. POLY-S9]
MDIYDPFDFIIKNYEWLFSGIGVTLLIAGSTAIKHWYLKRRGISRKSEIRQRVKNDSRETEQIVQSTLRANNVVSAGSLEISETALSELLKAGRSDLNLVSRDDVRIGSMKSDE